MPVSPRSLALSLTVGLSCAVAAFVVLAGPGTLPSTPPVAAQATPSSAAVVAQPVTSLAPCPRGTIETADACVRVVHAPPPTVGSPAPVPSPAAVYVVRPAVPTQRTAPATVPPAAVVDAAPQEPQQTEPSESERPESEG
jgi:hypothetical protein